MELKDYLRVLRRNWIIIVACALIGLLGAGAASLLMKPSYKSETKLFVALQSSGSVSELTQGNAFSQARVQSYVKTVTTPTVLQPVIDSLGLKVTPQALARSVAATSDVNTVLISIAVENESPVQAAAIAQAVSRSLIVAVDELERPSSSDSSPVKLSIVTPASAPGAPSSPNVNINLIVGLLLGLATGTGVAVLRSILDNRVRGAADLRRVTQTAILGGVSFDATATKEPLLTQIAMQSPRAESFRQLRTNLQFAHVSHDSKTVLITSSVPGEGKSTTATNLAIALAQAGQYVALVDADLRRPMIDQYLGLDRNAGLTTALIGQTDVDELLQPWGEDKLYVLTAGQIPPNPSELLGSDKMKQLIIRLETVFDAVIIDAPPLLPVTDAAVLAQQVGGVVLVVGTQKVRTTDVEKSLAALDMVEADLLGVVLNRLPAKGPDAYSYSYYSYESNGQIPALTHAKSRRQPLEENGSEANFENILRGEGRSTSRLRDIGGRGRGAQ
ncbi:polysaccharide biosynthesis tyrosine autokinase [Pseudarthrobacter sp. H3Y2-7]|uniref:polysaccharide biosynthesis tyrosine autokinase n=1 Tax=Pseudarthrobacter naphthalenicus TaxID=3031328 RepID=UPI0023B17A75|nr:polysaccharide biosynthesis tyrosine autokinase [Pseudarthrobacter sp. H3Y2-7]MDE8668140.1 polysaccharide biosynthesis tyrosine autokinase [Pseudarthrobacter sp. H3Y2-7]